MAKRKPAKRRDIIEQLPAGAFTPPEPSVMVAWVHSEMVAHSWFTSLMTAVMTTPEIGPYVAMRYGTDGLPAARTRVAEQFLTSGVDWLWVVDTDMGFAPDALSRLLASADPVERPIVGALCFANRETHTDGFGGYRCSAVPTLYQWAQRGDGTSGFAPIYDYPRDALVQVAGTGSACIVIHRSVFEKVAAKFGPVWYQRLTNPSDGSLLGEDLSFCARVVECGLPIFVNTAVKTTHLKPIWLQEDDYQRPEEAPHA